MSRGYFVGTVDSVGCSAASSAQLKHIEMSGSGGFVMEMGDFSFFLLIFRETNRRRACSRSCSNRGRFWGVHRCARFAKIM